MVEKVRPSGIVVVGDVPWGTHLCHFYETDQDLLEVSIAFLRAGLEGGEYCLWTVSEPLSVQAAWVALEAAVSPADRGRLRERVEIVPSAESYLTDGKVDLSRAVEGWRRRLDRALGWGHPGMRVTGATSWLPRGDWKSLCEYEVRFGEWLGGQPALALCSYSLPVCQPGEVLDVAGTHQFAAARRHGRWLVVDSPALVAARAEVQRLNEELEDRVEERTRLAAVNEELEREIVARQRAEDALRLAHAELAHANRVITMGEMAASIAHEVSQPLAAVMTNARASQRWLARARPDLREAAAAVSRIIEDSARATQVIERIRTLVENTEPKLTWLDINNVIAEVVTLTQGEVRRSRVTLRTDLADGLPSVLGDRVQLQQVLLNLLLNGLEAISAGDTGGSEPAGDLLIVTRLQEPELVCVEVRDSGVGLDPATTARLFDPFFTTKPRGMGMGLSICRSIVQACGGHIEARSNDGPGATFRFTLRAGVPEELEP
jgi:signal transduction histidine kinase